MVSTTKKIQCKPKVPRRIRKRRESASNPAKDLPQPVNMDGLLGDKYDEEVFIEQVVRRGYIRGRKL